MWGMIIYICFLFFSTTALLFLWNIITSSLSSTTTVAPSPRPIWTPSSLTIHSDKLIFRFPWLICLTSQPPPPDLSVSAANPPPPHWVHYHYHYYYYNHSTVATKCRLSVYIMKLSTSIITLLSLTKRDKICNFMIIKQDYKFEKIPCLCKYTSMVIIISNL